MIFSAAQQCGRQGEQSLGSPECRSSRVPRKMKLKIIEQFRRFSPVTCTKNALGGRARPGPTGGAIALPQLPRGRGGARGRKGLEIWGRKLCLEKDGKGERE